MSDTNQIPTTDIWKTKYLNELNNSCGATAFAISGRPLVKGQWDKKQWTLNDLESGRNYCCYKSTYKLDNTGENIVLDHELCADCSKWLDKYYRELAARESEIRGTDAVVPLLEKLIENQEKQMAKLDEILLELKTGGRPHRPITANIEHFI